MRIPVKHPFSCFSHLAGALAAVPGLVWLLIRSDGDPWKIVGISVFGMSLISLYSASTLYHWLHVSPRVERGFQRFDHVAIYFLIAGTYTPVCLVTLRGAWGWSIFGIVWGLAITGTALILLVDELPRWLSTSLYVLTGWVAVVAVVPLVAAVPAEGIAWLAAGGVFYTVGAVIYGLRRPDPFPRVFGHHEIFHVLVLAGSVSHFLFMLRYVVPEAS